MNNEPEAHVSQMDQLVAHTRDAAVQAATFYNGLRHQGVPRSESSQMTQAYIAALIQANSGRNKKETDA